MKVRFITAALITAFLCSCAPQSTPSTSGDAVPDVTSAPTATVQPTSVPMSSPAAESTPAPSPTPTPTPIPEKTAVPSEDSAATGNFNNLSNNGSGWGFRKNKGQEPSIYDSTKKLFEQYDTYYMDQTKPKAIYLTFDEGYENGHTASILDTLKKCNVPAAFFITGPYAEEQTELVQRMIDEGHIVGNHTVNHPNLPNLGSSEKMIKELNDLNSIVKDKYGIEMKYMRPPEGEWSERLLATAQSAGYKTILWSFAYRDWETDKQQGADYAFEQVTPYLHDGAILLLHAVSSDNAAALESIITYAKEQGYEFRSLDELS